MRRWIAGLSTGLYAVVLFAQPQSDGHVSPDQEGKDVTAAVTTNGSEESSARPALFAQERLTGDWAGARTWAEDHGIDLELGLTTIYQHNAHGGLRTHNAHRVSGSFDLELTLDFGAVKLVKGGTLYTLAEGSWDEGVSDHGHVGDLFGGQWRRGG